MRDIEFRGKPKHGKNKGFVCGNLRIIADYVGIETPIINPPEVIDVEVFPETVGQYTGLKDKSGKKIFEGDILWSLEYPFANDGVKGYVAEVAYDDYTASFFYEKHCVNKNLNGISDGIGDGFDNNASAFEVIGNIHDNPELLEGK